MAKFINLQNLTIDLANRNAAYIEQIAFPGIDPYTNAGTNTGNIKLKTVSITNTPIKIGTNSQPGSITLPSIEELIYTNNVYTPPAGGTDYNPGITISDTANDSTDKVVKVKITNSNITSLVMNNTANYKKNLSLYVTECSNLGKIEFTGGGYTLSGNATITECGELKSIGQNTSVDGSEVWKIDGAFTNDKEATFNVTNCMNLGDGSAKIILNYNFTTEQSLKVYAYGLTHINDAGYTSEKFIINRSVSAGIVYIYCDSSSNLRNYSTYNNTGYQFNNGASTQNNILVFPEGNHIRETAKSDVSSTAPAYERWVDSYDIVLRLGNNGENNNDSINNFLDSSKFTYYIEEEGIVRKGIAPTYVNIGYEIGNNDVIRFEGSKLIAKGSGESTITAYTTTSTETTATRTYIGEVNVLVRNIVNEVTLVDSSNPDPPAGDTKENPIYVSKNGKLSFAATAKYNSDDPLHPTIPGEHDEIYWMFAKESNNAYNNLLVNSEGNNVMSSLEATAAGISVVSDAWNVYTNTREFSFSNNGKYRILAQETANKKNNAANGDVIRDGRYIEVIGPASIEVSNKSIVHGSTDASASTINITNLKHADVSIKNADYSNYFEVIKTADNTSGSTITDNSQTWKLKIKDLNSDSDNARLQELIKNNNFLTLAINTDGAEREKSFNLSSVWEPAKTNTDNTDNSEAKTTNDNQNTYENMTPEEYTKLVEQVLGINQDSNQSGSEETYDSSDNSSSSNDGESSQSSSSDSQAASSSGSSSDVSTAAPSYTAPGKATVTQLVVVAVDGTSTKVEIHVDGTVRQTQELPVSTVLALNSVADMNTAAPTIIQSVNLVIDKKDASLNAKIENITAELQAVTINGNVSITPNMVTVIKDTVSSQLGNASYQNSLDIKVNTPAANGKPLTIIMSADSLKNKAKLTAYIVDPLTGGYILTEIPAFTYSSKNGLSVSGLTGGFEYQLVSAKQAKQIEQSILDSVKLSNDFAGTQPATAGSIVDVSKALSSSLSLSNVNKVEYSVSGNKASIDPKTGLLVVNPNAAKGSFTVSIKVTLKNGKTKTIKTKFKIS